MTFHPDESTEAYLDSWFAEQAILAPISLLTEDKGWRHGGPGLDPGSWQELPDCDHGGPQVVVDPIDGTRHLMFELRPAWTVIGVAGPGSKPANQARIEFGLVAEIPTPQAGWARELEAIKGQGCQLRETPLLGQEGRPPRALSTIDDARVDHGYFPFFAYHPDVRPASHSLAQKFFHRLARFEDARIEHCYDDQYIASGGQLALLALGQYTMVADLRPRLLDPEGRGTQCAKPYDLSGAVLCATEAGCRVCDLDGNPLDMPLDTQTPVGFLGFAGPRTRDRLMPHLSEVIPIPPDTGQAGPV
ncbi:MAG: hypothetical protein P1V35_10320 [Planctomycetota bacterium]|nr:hypothetical protein [Planctomycetota bacterium]